MYSRCCSAWSPHGRPAGCRPGPHMEQIFQAPLLRTPGQGRQMSLCHLSAQTAVAHHPSGNLHVWQAVSGETFNLTRPQLHVPNRDHRQPFSFVASSNASQSPTWSNCQLVWEALQVCYAGLQTLTADGGSVYRNVESCTHMQHASNTAPAFGDYSKGRAAWCGTTAPPMRGCTSPAG